MAEGKYCPFSFAGSGIENGTYCQQVKCQLWSEGQRNCSLATLVAMTSICEKLNKTLSTLCQKLGAVSVALTSKLP